MVLGISGCTSLLLTGFGIKDSIADVVIKQYEEIQIYDMTITFKESPTDQQQKEFERESDNIIKEGILVSEESVTLKNGIKQKDTTLIVPENSETIGQFIQLKDQEGTPLTFPGKNQAILTSKLAKKLNVGVGDTIIVENLEYKSEELEICGLTNNYVYSYIYISRTTYEDLFKQNINYNTYYCNLIEPQNYLDDSSKLLAIDNVSLVSATQIIKERFTSMMQSLNSIVLLTITSAAALAFIVLYNLTNINITERLREIATIKVLGFYSIETAIYVFRENFILTGIGTFCGLGLGIFLHRFVMSQIDMDVVAFDVKIVMPSYLYSILLTFAFAFIVNIIMYFKLNKINMAESLKSIE